MSQHQQQQQQHKILLSGAATNKGGVAVAGSGGLDRSNSSEPTLRCSPPDYDAAEQQFHHQLLDHHHQQQHHDFIMFDARSPTSPPKKQQQRQKKVQNEKTKRLSPDLLKGALTPPKVRSASQRRQYVDEPSDFDVISGRGGKSNHHPGNKRYRQVIKDTKAEYKTISTKSGKTDLSRAIVDHVYRYGGRFLKRVEDNDDDVIDNHRVNDRGEDDSEDDDTSNADSNLDAASDSGCSVPSNIGETKNYSKGRRRRKARHRYYILTPSEARRKTSQALRETKDAKWTM